MASIKATPIRAVFQADDYQVVIYKNLENGQEFTATGSNLPMNCDVILSGEVIETKKYGEQFKVSVAEEILPETKDKMIDYLVYAKIKHIGKGIAKRIVDKFGDMTFQAMEDPELLVTIRGISQEKAEEIAAEFSEKKVLQKYFEVAAQYGIPSSKVPAIYKKFGKMNNGLKLITTHPYMLCYCEGISFNRIDTLLRQKPGFDPYYIDRVRFGVWDAVQENESNGHLFAKWETIMQIAKRTLTKNIRMDHQYLDACISWVINQMIREQKLVYEYGVIYRKKMHDAEDFVAKKLLEILHATFQSPRTINEVRDAISKAQSKIGITLSPMQIKGIEEALMHNVCIITGGPGRGKTTVINVIMESEHILRPENEIELCAPTGRAARRMTENTGEDASTIHHLLGLHQHEEYECEMKEVEADVLIIDEMSMTSMELMCKLMKCVHLGTRFIFVGDKDQLPSVSAGNVFSELIASGVFPTVFLDVNFRQSAGSSIIENGDRINQNCPPLIWDDSSMLVNTYQEEDTLNASLYVVNDIIEKRIFRPEDIQVLTPFRKKTELGCEKLNAHLQKIFNPASPQKTEIKAGDRIFRVGDRVIHLKNEDVVSNGDVGYITDINLAEKQLTVRFETRIEKTYKNSEFLSIEHAFALTIHKAQGSEYPCVLMPFISLFGEMRQRPLLYTAVTRAKKFIGIIGNEESILYAAGNVGIYRNTFLAYRLEVYGKERGEK